MEGDIQHELVLQSGHACQPSASKSVSCISLDAVVWLLQLLPAKLICSCSCGGLLATYATYTLMLSEFVAAMS